MPRSSHPRSRRTLAVTLLLLAAPLLAVTRAAAQAPPALRLSLADAIARGMAESEEVRLANSSVEAAHEQVASARSGLYPQLNASLSYTRTIRSPINTGGGFTLPDSLLFAPDPSGTLAERVTYLEQRTPSAALGALGQLFSGLPFGQKNTYTGRVGLRQTLFDGQAFAGVAIAREFTGVASAVATEQRLDLTLAVIEAYYGAVLADRLADIVSLSAGQLSAQLAQIRLIRAAGNASDLDVLRVEVEQQNLEPQRVAALNRRDVAQLNLKRLINMPLDQQLLLSDSLGSEGFRAIDDARIDAVLAAAPARRATLRAAEREVEIRRQQVSLARAASLPTVSLFANLGTQALPSSTLPGSDDFRDDWNGGVEVQIPLFAGGRRRANVGLASVQLRQSEYQLAQRRESVALDLLQQRGELARASALITARAQTTAQAQRVFELTTLSYERGLQTALQLADARLQLQQAQANEAQALHDYYLALARLLRAAGVSAQSTDAPESALSARGLR